MLIWYFWDFETITRSFLRSLNHLWSSITQYVHIEVHQLLSINGFWLFRALLLICLKILEQIYWSENTIRNIRCLLLQTWNLSWNAQNMLPQQLLTFLPIIHLLQLVFNLFIVYLRHSRHENGFAEHYVFIISWLWKGCNFQLLISFLLKLLRLHCFLLFDYLRLWLLQVI